MTDYAAPLHEAAERRPATRAERRENADAAASVVGTVAGKGFAAARQPAAEHVIAMQRLAGNAAVAESMQAWQRRASGRTTPAGAGARFDRPLQRFVGSEHAELGDSTGASVDLGNGVVLTWGQVVAIAGDEYPSLDRLRADAQTDEGKLRIRAALIHDGVAGSELSSLEPKGMKPDDLKKAEATAQAQQEAMYNALVVANVSHFAAGGTAVATWTGYHQDALAKAVQAGLDGDEAAHQDALSREAFGEHFLTDCFSGGHVRTPRAAILDWYTSVFGPKVIVHVIDDLRKRLVSDFSTQITDQLHTPLDKYLDPILQAATREAADVIEEIMPAGLMVLGQQLGTYVAGGISGTLHDMEGERGVWVSSNAHPTPWVAYGDARLAQSPDSRSEAEAAIAAGKAQVEQAFGIGSRFRTTVAVPYIQPQATYFEFDSDQLGTTAHADCQSAGDYLRVHPEVTLTLVGHTCPLGADDYNLGLGLRRAEAVRAMIVASGVQSDRVTATSMGENQLVSADPKQYRLDRRVEYIWATRPVSEPSREQQEADAALDQACPPPYQPVIDRVPKEVPDLNVPVEDWHWGSIPPNAQAGFKTWLSTHIAPMVGSVLADKHLDPIDVPLVPGDPVLGSPPLFTLDPRAVATKELSALFADPAAYLGEAFGTPMGP